MNIDFNIFVHQVPSIAAMRPTYRRAERKVWHERHLSSPSLYRQCHPRHRVLLDDRRPRRHPSHAPLIPTATSTLTSYHCRCSLSRHLASHVRTTLIWKCDRKNKTVNECSFAWRPTPTAADQQLTLSLLIETDITTFNWYISISN